VNLSVTSPSQVNETESGRTKTTFGPTDWRIQDSIRFSPQVKRPNPKPDADSKWKCRKDDSRTTQQKKHFKFWSKINTEDYTEVKIYQRGWRTVFNKYRWIHGKMEEFKFDGASTTWDGSCDRGPEVPLGTGSMGSVPLGTGSMGSGIVILQRSIELGHCETLLRLRHVTSPFLVSSVPTLTVEVAHRYRTLNRSHRYRL
jgi:hypothetical protein